MNTWIKSILLGSAIACLSLTVNAGPQEVADQLNGKPFEELTALISDVAVDLDSLALVVYDNASRIARNEAYIKRLYEVTADQQSKTQALKQAIAELEAHKLEAEQKMSTLLQQAEQNGVMAESAFWALLDLYNQHHELSSAIFEGQPELLAQLQELEYQIQDQQFLVEQNADGIMMLFHSALDIDTTINQLGEHLRLMETQNYEDLMRRYSDLESEIYRSFTMLGEELTDRVESRTPDYRLDEFKSDIELEMEQNHEYGGCPFDMAVSGIDENGALICEVRNPVVYSNGTANYVIEQSNVLRSKTVNIRPRRSYQVDVCVTYILGICVKGKKTYWEDPHWENVDLTCGEGEMVTNVQEHVESVSLGFSYMELEEVRDGHADWFFRVYNHSVENPNNPAPDWHHDFTVKYSCSKLDIKMI